MSKVLEKLNAIEQDLIDEIKSIDDQVATLRQERSKLYKTLITINPDRKKKIKKARKS